MGGPKCKVAERKGLVNMNPHSGEAQSHDLLTICSRLAENGHFPGPAR